MKLGAAQKEGCAEADFSLKRMLQSRRQMGIDVRAIFVDLEKVRESMKHDVSSLSLKIMGATDRHSKWVKKVSV